MNLSETPQQLVIEKVLQAVKKSNSYCFPFNKRALQTLGVTDATVELKVISPTRRVSSVVVG